MLALPGPTSMNHLALVIDRDAGTRKLLDVLLQRFGYEVDRVAASANGITLLEVVDYDFVLCDDDTVVRWIAANRPSALPRVMILSSAPESHLVRMRNEWLDVPVIRKPFELADVIDGSRAAAAKRAARITTLDEVFARRSVTAGAKSGVIVRNGGDVLELMAKFGYEPGLVEQWFPLASSNPYPICMAVKHGRAVWLASLANAQAEYPLLAPIWQTYQSRAIAVVPLFRGGTIIGAAGWTFREPQRFTEAEQRMWTAIAESTAPFVNGGHGTQSTTQAGA